MNPPYLRSILFSTLLIPFIISAQNKRIVDSLLHLTTNRNTSDTTLIKAFNDLGVQYATSDPFVAKKYIYKALDIANKIKRPRGIAGANNCLGIVYYHQKEYDSALVHFKQALQINKETEHLWGQASAINQIGAVHNYLNQYHKAIQSFTEAGTIFKSLNDSISYIKSIENTGVSYVLMNYQKKALEHYLQANKLYEKLHHEPGIRRTYIKISNILIRQEEYQKALSYLHTCLPGIEETGNQRYLSNLFKNMGVSYKGLGDYSKALYYLQKSLSLRKGKPKTSASIQSDIGQIYFEMKRYNKGLEYLKIALQNYSQKGDHILKATTHNFIAKSFLQLHQLDSARYYAKKSLYASNLGLDLKAQKEANYTLARIAEKSNNSLAAYRYYKNLTKLKDTLDIIEKNAHIRELQTQFEVDKKELKIHELERKNEQVKSQNLLITLGLLVGLIILTSLVFIFRKKFKLSCFEKTLLSKELDTKRKELATNSLHLAKKNKVLENLKEEVEHIRYTEDQDKQYTYQKLIQAINFDRNDDKDWENFKKYFEQIHKDFYRTIKHQYPKVTTNELRLMALLKMNLSSKEIARILHITQEGVRKARYRLRKKLAIESNQGLMEMILNI